MGLELGAGEYVHVAVRAVGVDITIELVGPDGSDPWTSIDRPTAEGLEELWLLTPAAGLYELRVRSRWGEPGAAVVEALDHHEPTDEDLRRLRAETDRREGEAERRRSGGDLEAALEHFRSARRDFEALGLFERAGEAATREAIVLAKLDRVDEAEELLRRTVEAAALRGDRTTQARGLNSLAVRAYQNRGDLRQTLALIEEAKRIGAEDPLLASMVETNLGLFQALAGEHRKAAEQMRRAAMVAHDLGFVNGEASAWFNASLAHRGLRDYGAYLEDLRRADPLLARMGQAVDQGRLRMNEGIAYVDLGEPERAADRFRDALEVLPEGEVVERARAELNLGQVALELGDPTEALSRLDRCLEALQGRAEPKLEGSARGVRAEIALALGHREEAIDDARRSVELARDSGVERILPDALVVLAEALARGGDLDGAERALSEALEVAERQEDPKVGVTAQLERARIRRQRGDLAGALHEVEVGIAGVESLRDQIPTLELQATLLARYRSLFDLGIEIRYDLSQTEPGEEHPRAAFALAERARARSLLDSLPALAWRRDAASERLRDLGAALASAREDHTRAESEGPDAAAESARQLDQAILDYETARRAWIDDHPHEAGRLARQPATSEDLQAALGPRETLLEYHAGEERTFLFAVTRDRLELLDLGATDDLGRDVEAFLPHLLKPTVRGAAPYRQVAERLFHRVVPPSVARALEHREVLASPDGPLVGVPFEALVTQPSGRTFRELAYFGNTTSLTYLPSAAVGLELRARPEASSALDVLVAFADPSPGATQADLPPLPGARAEAEALARLFEPAAAWLGDEASETRVRALTGSPPRYLHFATHASIDERRPELSAVLLAPDGVDDGRLEGWEIATLRLPVQQVVLSACGSGLGRPVPGEGLVGLVQAFFDAGARSVVASYWPLVDRGTAPLMVDFYRGLGEVGAARSLARARRAQIARGGLSAHPYYWASFVVFGSEASPRIDSR